MLTGRFSLYEILGVSHSASTADIKTAFRTLAQECHPDKNKNSPDSTALFQTIQNAYAVLADPAKRMAYDSSIPAPTSINAQSSPTGRGESSAVALRGDAAEVVLSHLNFILWDIEELIHASAAAVTRKYVLMMLTFIDRWVLDAAGFPDYFFRSRQIEPTTKIGGRPSLPYQDLAASHQPYVDAEDYFYDVRRRSDRLMNRARLSDLLAPIPDTPIRVIDGLLEAHNYCIHYLGWLRRRAAEHGEQIPSFSHSNPIFEQ